MCDIIFEKVKGVYAEVIVQKVLSKRCYVKFRRIHKKTSVSESRFLIKLNSVFLIKLKLDSSAGVSCEFCKIHKKTFSVEHHQTTASD